MLLCSNPVSAAEYVFVELQLSQCESRGYCIGTAILKCCKAMNLDTLQVGLMLYKTVERPERQCGMLQQNKHTHCGCIYCQSVWCTCNTSYAVHEVQTLSPDMLESAHCSNASAYRSSSAVLGSCHCTWKRNEAFSMQSRQAAKHQLL